MYEPWYSPQTIPALLYLPFCDLPTGGRETMPNQQHPMETAASRQYRVVATSFSARSLLIDVQNIQYQPRQERNKKTERKNFSFIGANSAGWGETFSNTLLPSSLPARWVYVFKGNHLLHMLLSSLFYCLSISVCLLSVLTATTALISKLFPIEIINYCVA